MAPSGDPGDEWPAGGLLRAVSAVFESLGRALVCLDPDFRAVHASEGLDSLLGAGCARGVLGRPAEEIFGVELFGAEGSLRRALAAGERREGWGATLQSGSGRSCMVSLSAAPVIHRPDTPCDPRVAYLVVLRSAASHADEGGERPTLFAGMVARSRPMLQIFHLIERLQESDATVLVVGESGTGKELVARAVHIHSPRHSGPFVAVNCGALPGELLESELFGHVRGAFTGAVQNRQGRFELAAGGTLFLDEVGDLPLHLQVKLLRVLQERTFERVGESSSRPTDARVIAATNKDLRAAIETGEFRDDLYYRLRVVPIAVPPLRQRREDIEPLARHLMGRISRRHGRTARLSPDILRTMMRYAWPGNVRELENALEYALAVSPRETLLPQDLPSEVLEATAVVPPAPPALAPPPLELARPAPSPPPGAGAEEAEAARIRGALEAHRWQRAQAAAALGMSRTTLWRKMRELGLTR